MEEYLFDVDKRGQDILVMVDHTGVFLDLIDSQGVKKWGLGREF